MFDVRDLMINLAARFPAYCGPQTLICYPGATLGGGGHVHQTLLLMGDPAAAFRPPGCPGHSAICGCGTGTTAVTLMVDAALAKQYQDAAKNQLATLKEQLREALAEVEKQEQILQESEKK